MSCPNFVISESGRAAIGVGQGQFAGDYPIVSPSDDIAGLIADMHFAYDDLGFYINQPVKKEPLSIKYLSGLGCLAAQSGVPSGAHAADIRIVDATGATVFDSFADATVVYTKKTWSADYEIHEWRGEYAICRIVVYTTWPKTDINDTDQTTARNYASKIAPASAVINARAVYKMPKRLLSMRVNTAGITTDKTKGQIVFKNGYNTEIAADGPTTTNFRANTKIAISGVAGSGLGRFFDCADADTSSVITTINGVTPGANGDFVMGGVGCLWSGHPVLAPTQSEDDSQPAALVRDPAAGIKFGADCKACCSCEDYADTAAYMNQVAYRYQLIGQRAQEVYTQHETNVANWADASCVTGEIMRMVTTAQECGAIDVAVTLCNTCSQCIPAAALTFDMYLPSPPDRPVPVALNNIFHNTPLHGNRLMHGVDCSYTKISGSELGTAVRVAGSYETQFGNSGDVIDATGNPYDGPSSVGTLDTAMPKLKQKSLLWPTLVPNIFSAGSPTTEPEYGRNPFGCGYVPHPFAPGEVTYEELWELIKARPIEERLFWRATPLGPPGWNQFSAQQVLYYYGIRIEDCPPIPDTGAVDVVNYLDAKFVKKINNIPPIIDWDVVGKTTFNAAGGVPFLRPPTEHNRWWSPIDPIGYGTEKLDGRYEMQVYEMLNECQLGAILSSPAAITALAARLEIFDATVTQDVFIGLLSNDFATDVVPAVGMSVVDKFGFFSSWSPDGGGVTGYWPAEITKVYVEDNAGLINAAADIIWLRIKRPNHDPSMTQTAVFPDVNIDFDTDENGVKIKSLHAQAFGEVRFYNMNVFSEHIKREKCFVGPFPAPQDFPSYNNVGDAAGTIDVAANAYELPDRYIGAATPRRVTINTPAVAPGSTIQIDFRITFNELDLLVYVSQYTTAEWLTCSDTAAPLKFCDAAPFNPAALALYDGSDRLEILGPWADVTGEDGKFYINIPAGPRGLSPPNGLSRCPPPGFFIIPPCSDWYAPKYWELLRWKKLYDETIVGGGPLTDEQYLYQYACSSDGNFSGVVTRTAIPTAPDEEPIERIKVCGLVSVSDGQPLTKRKVRPRNPYRVSLVLTGKKPTGALADLTKQHILDRACEGTPGAKKAIIKDSVQLKCTETGSTPDC